MDKVIVAYWSQTGNTAAMAAAIGEGITEAGKEAVVTDISSVSMDDLQAASAFALGCPAMGAEVLEEGEMEPFVTEVEAFASGKKIGLFGSYGWGDGQWMRDWEERMKAACETNRLRSLGPLRELHRIVPNHPREDGEGVDLEEDNADDAEDGSRNKEVAGGECVGGVGDEVGRRG